MKKLFFMQLSFIILLFILEVKGAKKKTKAKNNNKKESNAVLADSGYCQHFKNSKIYLDKTKLDQLDSNQYINAEFATNKEVFSDGAKLDYYIRYSVISRGLCYYDEDQVQEISKFPKFPMEKANNQTEVDSVRYDKTFNCFYYYYKYALPESQNELLINHPLAINHLSEYLTGIYSFLFQEDLCPDPKENMIGKFDSEQNPQNRINLYYNERVNFIEELKQFNLEINSIYGQRYPNQQDLLDFETVVEHDTNNLEICQCGYPTKQQRDEFCNRVRNNDICCHLTYHTTPLLAKTYTEPIYYGIAVSSFLIIAGSYFSSKIIKEIRMQENIKKSILNQEKEYQQSHENNLLNAYKEGFDPKAQTFNSNSRNLNGTLRPNKNMSTMSGSETLGMNSNSRIGTMGARNGGSMGRYPPNSYNVAEDYNSSDARDLSLRRGMIVQLVQKYEGGWVMVKDIQTNRQGYAPEYCLGNKMM